MKRLHIHISVEDLNKSRAFYTAQFGAEPTKVKPDYMQWLLDDPAVNFAISTGGETKGLNHLGIQVDSDEALEATRSRLEAAGVQGKEQSGASCCYARSEKYWVQDPESIIWENYHTSEQIEIFGGDDFTGGIGCCTPSVSKNALWSTSECC